MAAEHSLAGLGMRFTAGLVFAAQRHQAVLTVPIIRILFIKLVLHQTENFMATPGAVVLAG